MSLPAVSSVWVIVAGAWLVTVTVAVCVIAVPLPATMVVGAAATVDCALDTGPAVTVTGAVWVIPVPFAIADTVFVPFTVELSVPVATPLPSVGPTGCVTVFPVPVAASTTVAPLTGVPLASFAVTVIVDVSFPAAIDAGDATTVERTGSTPDPAPEAALISTPSAPPFRLVQVAATVLRFVAHSASRSPGVLSPDRCSTLSVNPAPGSTTATLRFTPKA